MKKLMMLALVAGPFSGVDYEHIDETPILGTEAVLEMAAEELIARGQGMELVEQDGAKVALVTDAAFHIALQTELEAGDYGLAVAAQGRDRGSDSFWLEVDGERLDASLGLPLRAIGERSVGFRIAEGGAHTLRLVLREAPGPRIRSLRLRRHVIHAPREPMTSDLAGQHPRMFFTADDIDAMRVRLHDKTVQRYYRLAGALDREPPEFVPGARNGGSFRRLPGYALSYVLAPSQEKLDGIVAWLKMAATYPHVGADLDAEYFMEGVALTYDWLYHDLPEDVRTDVRDLLCRQARHVYELSLSGRTGGGLSFQQNHYWFAHLSLAFAASAVYGEAPEARDWLAWAWDRCERVFMTFGPDGGFHEGPSYWDFSMPAFYMMVDLYERFTGLRVPAADQGLRGQAVFRLHHLYPGMERTTPLEDTTIRTGRPPMQLLLWEARRFQDGVAMGIAEMLNRDASTHAFHLLWLDEGVQAQDPTEMAPAAQYYPDIETIFARTSWDGEATYLAAVSRPLGGHFWAEMCDRFGLGGTGHNHPEQGHFVLFGRGETLAHDPGYTYEKRTRNHNTVLVDGQGQYGDGEMWPSPKPGRARMTGMVHAGDITIIAADPSSAYPENLGLTRFDRIFVLAGRDLAVIHDRLAADRPRTFSWLLHHIGTVEETSDASGWRIVRGGAQLAVAPLRPQSVMGETSAYMPIYTHPSRDHTPDKDAEMGLLELKAGPAAETTFLVPMLVGNAGSEIPTVQDLCRDGVDAVRVGDTVVAFNRGEGEMTVPMPDGGELTIPARAVVATMRDGARKVVSLP